VMAPQPPAPELLADPFACWLAVDVGGVADTARQAPRPGAIVDDLIAAPVRVVDDEISEAFDTLLMAEKETTVPVLIRIDAGEFSTLGEVRL